MKKRVFIYLALICALVLLLGSCKPEGATPSDPPEEPTEYPEGYSPVSANVKYAPWWWIATLEEGAAPSAETMPKQWRFDEPEAYRLAKAICDYSPMFRFWVEYDSLEAAPDWYLLLTALDHAPNWDLGYLDRLEDQDLRGFLEKAAEENQYTEGSAELPEEYLKRINENRGYAFEKDVQASFEKLYGDERAYRAMDVENPDGVPGVYPRMYRYFGDQEIYFRGYPYSYTRCWYPQILSYSETEEGFQAEVLNLDIYSTYEKGLLMPPPTIPDHISDEEIDKLAAEYPVQRYTFEELENGTLAVTGIENMNFHVEIFEGTYQPVVEAADSVQASLKRVVEALPGDLDLEDAEQVNGFLVENEDFVNLIGRYYDAVSMMRQGFTVDSTRERLLARLALLQEADRIPGFDQMTAEEKFRQYTDEPYSKHGSREIVLTFRSLLDFKELQRLAGDENLTLGTQENPRAETIQTVCNLYPGFLPMEGTNTLTLDLGDGPEEVDFTTEVEGSGVCTVTLTRTHGEVSQKWVYRCTDDSAYLVNSDTALDAYMTDWGE